jgi:hypothetical protein
MNLLANFKLEWLVSPLTISGLSATTTLVLLYLWCSALVQLQSCRKELGAIRESTDNNIRNLTMRFDELASRPAPEPEPQPVFVPAPTIGDSINLTKRTRALQMRRRGEELHTISAALGCSSGELNLLLKLDRLARQNMEQS